jgi:hypothetical protein
MTMKKTVILTAGLATTAAALIAFALGQSGGPGPAVAQQTSLTTSYLDGYELDPSLDAAAVFPGNELVFEAGVVGRDAARKVTAKGTDERLTYIYTPVRVQVIKVMKGDLKVGQTLTVRALGGTVADERTVSRLSPDPAQYADGRRLVLMTARPVDAGDGLSAVTPNYLLGFDEKRGSVFNIDHPAESLPIATFSKVLSSSRGTSTAK